MIREFVKKLVKPSGYELLGRGRAYAMPRSLVGMIRQEQINLVLDVGANAGQFAAELREAGYDGRIISFEPLSSAHKKLQRCAQNDPNWTVADRTAIGAVAGSIEIHIAGNSASSSILRMLPSVSEAEPRSSYVGAETVPINRLDDICTLAPADRVLLKIDVQGYEKQVLDGAQRILATCRAVMLEMSLIPLYDGEVLAREMWGLLDAQGFDVWNLEPGFRHPQTGRMLQVDGCFVRRTAETHP